jgi:hypothetical protein
MAILGIKLSHSVFEPGRENVYLSTCPPPKLIHLSHRFTSASKSATQTYFDCCFSHFRTSVSTSSSSAKRLPPSCEPLYATNTSHRKQQTFRYEYPLHWVMLPTKNNTTERCCSVLHASSTVAILTEETSFWTYACTSATKTVMKLDCAAT